MTADEKTMLLNMWLGKLDRAKDILAWYQEEKEKNLDDEKLAMSFEVYDRLWSKNRFGAYALYDFAVVSGISEKVLNRLEDMKDRDERDLMVRKIAGKES